MKPAAELFGRDATPQITAVELTGDSEITLYRREADRTVTERRPFQPFLWIPEQIYLQGFDRKVEFTPLHGGGEFKFLARFNSWKDFQAARQFLRDAPAFSLNDPAQQYLMGTGQTHFKTMRFEQLHRLQIAVAGATIRLADNTGWQAEVKKPEELVAAIRARDPDVIEGHDIFRHIFPQLAGTRSALKLGRDGSAITSRQSRIQIAEKTIQYPKYEIHGRHIVDTFLLTQFYDVSTRELEDFDLDSVAEHFGLNNLPAPQQVARISELLSPSYFIQAQIFPYRYQDVVVRGNATKIDALLLREYLHQRRAIPQLGESRFFAGGYTDIFHEGLLQNVWHCDAQSLYPSLILAFDIKPRRDELNLFASLLRDLREFRLQAKTTARTAPDESTRQHAAALQQTFKILINSFYGYLGFGQAHFGDFNAAEQVTARGREILKTMLDGLQQRGAKVIEIDTDGLYFVPPPGSEPGTLEAELQHTLPKGVDVEIDGQYPAMFSYKMKNYALLDAAGRLHVKGSALRSRGLEKFQRQFLEELLTLTLRGDAQKVPALYEEYCRKIERHELAIELLAKTDTLQDTLDVYRQKIAQSARHRSAPYELALQSGRNGQPGDRISFYITGAKKNVNAYENAKLVTEFDPARRDENVDYYLDKLRALYNKFAPLLAGAKPVAARPARDDTPDLFG